MIDSGYARSFLALGLAASLALAACGDEHTDDIHIGGLFSTTGSLAQVGFAQLSAARLAVEQINDAGGVHGKRLVLVYRDDGTDSNKARRAAGALQAEGVSAVIGTVSSSLTQLAAGDLAPGAVMVSGSATSNSLRASGANGSVFRTCASDDGEGRLLAKRARGRGLQKAAIIRRADEAERGLADAFAEYFKRDGQLVAHEAYAPGQESYDELLARVLAAGPEVILLDADPVDGAEIVRDYLVGHPGRSVHWMFTHSVQDSAFVSLVGKRSFTFSHEGTGPGTPMGRRYAGFAAAWEAKYGAPPTVGAFAANVYDAVFLVALAMERAGSADAAALRDSLPNVSTGGMAFGPDEYGAAVAALRTGGDVNYEGASGSVDLNASGDTSAPYDVWMVQDGDIVLVERAVTAPL